MKIKKSRKRALYFSSLFTVASLNLGCAFGTRSVNVAYEDCVSSPSATTIERAVSVGEFNHTLELDKKERPIIGCVRNGYGMRTAKVVASNNPSEWVKEAFAKELRTMGYQVSNESDIRLNGTVVNLYTDMYLNYDSKLSLRVRVNQGERVHYDKIYEGNAKKIAWFVTPKEYGDVSNKALQDVMKKALPEIARTLDKLIQTSNDKPKI